MTHSNLDLYDIIQLCESLGALQRVEELCAVAGILIAAQPRNILEIGVYSGGQDNLVVTYDLATPLSPLSSLVGQSMQGNWTLRVADLAVVDIGKSNKWSLELSPAA